MHGSGPYSIDGLAAWMAQVSDKACQQLGELKELNLNPVRGYLQGQGRMAVDALIVKFCERAGKYSLVEKDPLAGLIPLPGSNSPKPP